ncbi:permease [Vibrio paracholerae 877-163]|nr:permease [Vibrio paracholerae 877-163]
MVQGTIKPKVALEKIIKAIDIYREQNSNNRLLDKAYSNNISRRELSSFKNFH